MSAARFCSPFATEPGSRPGERVTAGRVVTHDLDALGDWLAADAKRTAPADLSGLSDDEVTGLVYKGLRLAALSGNRDLELFRRAEAERDQRAAQEKAA